MALGDLHTMSLILLLFMVDLMLESLHKHEYIYLIAYQILLILSTNYRLQEPLTKVLSGQLHARLMLAFVKLH